MIVALAQDDLWSKVLWCPTECETPICYFLREAKISYFHVTVRSYQQVFGLEITVGNLPQVEIFQSERDLSNVE